MAKKQSLWERIKERLGYDGAKEWFARSVPCRGLDSYNQTPAWKQSKRKRKSTRRKK